jgi:hypothetical protein
MLDLKLQILNSTYDLLIIIITSFTYQKLIQELEKHLQRGLETMISYLFQPKVIKVKQRCAQLVLRWETS